jgi:hypothetical protein
MPIPRIRTPFDNERGNLKFYVLTLYLDTSVEREKMNIFSSRDKSEKQKRTSILGFVAVYTFSLITKYK